MHFWIFGFLVSIFQQGAGEYHPYPHLPTPKLPTLPTPPYPPPPYLPLPTSSLPTPTHLIPTYPYPPHPYLHLPTTTHPTPVYPWAISSRPMSTGPLDLLLIEILVGVEMFWSWSCSILVLFWHLEPCILETNVFIQLIPHTELTFRGREQVQFSHKHHILVSICIVTRGGTMSKKIQHVLFQWVINFIQIKII